MTLLLCCVEDFDHHRPDLFQALVVQSQAQRGQLTSDVLVGRFHQCKGCLHNLRWCPALLVGNALVGSFLEEQLEDFRSAEKRGDENRCGTLGVLGVQVGSGLDEQLDRFDVAENRRGNKGAVFVQVAAGGNVLTNGLQVSLGRGGVKFNIRCGDLLFFLLGRLVVGCRCLCGGGLR